MKKPIFSRAQELAGLKAEFDARSGPGAADLALIVAAAMKTPPRKHLGNIQAEIAFLQNALANPPTPKAVTPAVTPKAEAAKPEAGRQRQPTRDPYSTPQIENDGQPLDPNEANLHGLARVASAIAKQPGYQRHLARQENVKAESARRNYKPQLSGLARTEAALNKKTKN